MSETAPPLKLRLPDDFDITLLEGAFSGTYQIRTEQIADGHAVTLDTLHDDLVRSKRLLLKLDHSYFLSSTQLDCLDSLHHEGDAQFVQELPESNLRRQLSDMDSLRAFVPRHACHLTFQRLCLLDDEEKTLARIQHIELATPQQRVQWVEVQALRGYRKAYQTVVNKLAAIPKTKPLNYSKLMKRLGFSVSSYHNKPDLALQAEESIKTSVTRMIQAHLQIARANEAGTIADIDTEYLHDYRVNLRKIRSIISLVQAIYSPEQTTELKTELAEFMQVTNRLRDLDVYLLDQDDYLAKVPEKYHIGLRMMFTDFARERKSVLLTVQRRLQSKSYQQTITQLQSLFTDSENLSSGKKSKRASRHYACQLIAKRYAKVCQIAGEIHADTPDEEVHELRIQCKKLRYLMEFFTPFYPADKIKKLIKSLKVLQNNLGRFNDYSVQQESLQTYLSENEQLAKVERKAIKQLIKTLHSLQVEERQRVEKNFIRFNSKETQSSFHKLFVKEEN